MAAKKMKHDQPTPTSPPVLQGSVLPISASQLSQQYALPLMGLPGLSGALSGLGSALPGFSASALPVAMLGQSMLLPQAAPQTQTPSEPVLLLPTSSLAGSCGTSGVTSSPLLDSKLQSSSLLQASPFLLNNGALPLVLNPAVLPLSSSNLPQSQFHQRSLFFPETSSKTNLTNTEVSTAGESLVKAATKRKLSSPQSKIFQENCRINQSERGHSIEHNKVLALNSGVTSGFPAKNSMTETPDPANSSAAASVNYPDLSKIISNLPSGWKIVGLTSLNGTEESSGAKTDSVGSSGKLLSSENAQGKVLPVLSKNAHEQPGVVSINLNNSFPMSSSATSGDEIVGKELKCSLQMDNIPCTREISIKTDFENNAKSDDGSKQRNRESRDDAHSAKNNAGHSKLQIPLTFGSLDQQWTIVGITSIATSGVNTSVVNTMAIPNSATTTTSQSVGREGVKGNLSGLSISSASSQNFLNTETALSKSSVVPSPSLLCSENTMIMKSFGLKADHEKAALVKPEEMKWTVVGVTGTVPKGGVSTGPQLPISDHCGDIMTSEASTLLPTGAARVLPVVETLPVPLSVSLGSTEESTTKELNLSVGQVSQLDESKCPKSPSSFLISNRSGSAQNHGEEMNTVGIKSEAPEDLSNKKTKEVESGKASVLSDGINKCSAESEWKVVGIAPLGSTPPLNPLLAQPKAHSFHPQLSALSPNALLSPLNLSPAASTVSTPSSLSSLVQQNSGAQPSSTVSLQDISRLGLPLSSVNAAVPPVNSQAAQQSLLQMIQNQLLCQNNSALTNPQSQWNVVGVVANNQVSMLDSAKGNSSTGSGNHEKAFGNSIVTEGGKSERNSTVPKVIPENKLSSGFFQQKRNFTHSKGRWKTIKRSSDWRLHQFKCKDLISKSSANKVKKNTVSNLLMMKRLQREGNLKEEVMQSYPRDIQCPREGNSTSKIFEVTPELLLERKSKQRSLRSYAGNRKVFTIPSSRPLEKINLRSGTQVPVLNYTSDEEKEEGEVSPINLTNDSIKLEKIEMDSCELREVTGLTQLHSVSSSAIGGRSSASKRKSKIPRKMVTDLDYHPYESDSDSN